MDTDSLFDVFDKGSVTTEASKNKRVKSEAQLNDDQSVKINGNDIEEEGSDEENSKITDIKLSVNEMPCILVHTVETLESCLHEVAIPLNSDYIPLKNPLEDENHKPAKQYPFILDPFQKESICVLENYQSVMVAAHTSAGKTAIAEYAIAMSLRDKQRVIYTTPIKALSNQKYRELFEEFQDVGLMTGDITINPNASCLVMTTEILRSMLYKGSEIMREVGWVIFDEIHYMRDKERGVVWEETIILLPDKVHYVFLSATIPNARQFAEWICYLHNQVTTDTIQPCHVVYTDYRPTPLQHYVFPLNGDSLTLAVNEKGDFLENNFTSAMSSLKDPSDTNDRNKKNGPHNSDSDVYKLVKMIMERNFQPVIVFSFSRKECELHALKVANLDFNSEEEKKLVEEVFKNAIDVLSDEDKLLPQIHHLLPILKKGIGIHHSGLLPIIKETIEILFSEGLIKALFATETFSMGLNMPARTVLFSNCKKFDGAQFRWMTSGEYIQMSGRAGRRGIDDMGIVIIILDQRMSSTVAKNLIKGKADPLNSAFHLTYNMVLNLLRVEGINPEYMLEKSFYQFQNYATIPDLQKKIAKLEEEQSGIQINNESEIARYHKLRSRLEELTQQLRSIINKPEHVVPYLQPGRMVKVKNKRDLFDWGVVVNFQRRTKKADPLNANTLLSYSTPNSSSTDACSEISSKYEYVVYVLMNICKRASDTRLTCDIKPALKELPNVESDKTDKAVKAKNGDKKSNHFTQQHSEMEVVPVLLPLIHEISSIRLFYPKDLKSHDNRQSVLKNIREVERRFPDGLPLLDPIEDMGIKDKELKERIEAYEAKIYSHPLFNKPEIEKDYENYIIKIDKVNEKQQTYASLQKTMSIIKMDELKQRKRLLRRLGFCLANDVIDLKGRVACEISSGDELILTELIFNGAFNNLNVDQIVALLSCFVFQEKGTEIPKLSVELAEPLRMMQETARRIAKISKECKLEIDELEYVNSFKTNLMDVVYAWSRGAPFHEIIKMTDVFEGSIIRCMRRLEELLREMYHAAKAIGNVDLENKFSEGCTKIKRDIIFAASLYL